MDQSLLQLLLSVPFVGVFAWFAIRFNSSMMEAQKLFLAALDKRDAEFERRNAAIVDALNCLSGEVRAHETKTADRIEAIRLATIEIEKAKRTNNRSDFSR